MAQLDPIRFGDVAVMLGNGASPEVFSAPCGPTSITRTRGTNTTNEDLPDCDDPDAPGFESPTVISRSESIQVQGFVDADGVDAWDAAYDSDEPINVRLVYTKGTNATGGKKGHLQAPAVITNKEESYERRQAGRVNVTIAFKAKPVWTPIT